MKNRFIVLFAVVSGALTFLAIASSNAQETSASFAGGSVKIGDDNRVCAPSLEGAIRYTAATNIIEFCNGTAWTAGSGGSSLCPVEEPIEVDGVDNTYGQGVWQQGGYIFITQDANSGTAKILADDVTTGLQVGSYNFPGGRTPRESSIWGDGTYVYVGAGTYLYAFSFDGTTFTPVSVNTGQNVNDIRGDGTYIYIANAATGIAAYTFDGTTLAQAGASYNTSGTARSIWANATHVYAVNQSSALGVFTFNGTAFTLVDAQGGSYDILTGDDNYIYVANYYGDSDVLTFDGSSLTDTGVNLTKVRAASNGYVYTGNTTAVVVYAFDGTTATYGGTYAGDNITVRDINVGDNGRVYEMGSYGGVISLPDCSF